MAIYVHRCLVQLCMNLFHLLGLMKMLNTLISFVEVHLSTLYPTLIIKLYPVFIENKHKTAAKTS